jgi:PPOX class probable F420-dependent enzyme
MDVSDALDHLRGRRQGVLVTLRRDGRSQLSNIIFHLGDDGIIRISVTDDRAKTRNLRRDPRASFHVTSADMYQYVVAEGTAELTPVTTAPDDPTANELAAVYRGVAGEHPDWADFRRAMIAERRLVVRIPVDRVYGMA